jgi:16S rRNA (guanine1207-N2)-methyltransferase
MTTPAAPDRYAFWQNAPLSIAGSRVLVATKPGVFAHGIVDPASMMLAEQMASMGRSTSVHLNCGNGMVPAAAAVAGGASVLWCSDRSLPSVQATTRTMSYTRTVPMPFRWRWRPTWSPFACPPTSSRCSN